MGRLGADWRRAQAFARKPSERVDAGGAATRSEAMLRGDGRRDLRADLERPALRAILAQLKSDCPGTAWSPWRKNRSMAAA